MEDTIISLKRFLSSVPVKILNCSSREILSKNLDFKQPLTSKKTKCNRDYRGLGELVGLERHKIKVLERSKESPTQLILDDWETKPIATLEKLIEYLEEMERYDVIQELIPSFEKAGKAYFDSQKSQEVQARSPKASSSLDNTQPEKEMQIFTVHDIKTGRCTYYDAYVAYADEDIEFVMELASFLESDDIGLKLFIRCRDLLAGFSEHEANIKLIKERCRRMLIILSPNFVNSSFCKFQSSFAASMAIEQRGRICIPIIYAPCEIPLILNFVHKIDFTKPCKKEWIWPKLINSLLPEDEVSKFSMKHLSHTLLPPTSVALPAVGTNPMIIFPSTSTHTPILMDDSSNTASSVKSDEAIVISSYKNGTVSAKSSNKAIRKR